MAEVEVTDRARAKLDEWLKQGKFEARGLQLTLVQTHCMGGHGYTYGLAPAPAAVPGNGADGPVRISIRPEDAPRLEGTVIDFEEGLQGGFLVNNPHAVGKCHCGRHDYFE